MDIRVLEKHVVENPLTLDATKKYILITLEEDEPDEQLLHFLKRVQYHDKHKDYGSIENCIHTMLNGSVKTFTDGVWKLYATLNEEHRKRVLDAISMIHLDRTTILREFVEAANHEFTEQKKEDLIKG